MGSSEVAQQGDQVVDSSPPRGTPNFGVDMSDPQTVRGVFDPRCEVGPTGKLPELDAQSISNLGSGQPSDLLGQSANRDGITLPGTQIVNEYGQVLAGGEQQKATVAGTADQPPGQAVPGQPPTEGDGAELQNGTANGDRAKRLDHSLPQMNMDIRLRGSVQTDVMPDQHDGSRTGSEQRPGVEQQPGAEQRTGTEQRPATEQRSGTEQQPATIPGDTPAATQQLAQSVLDAAKVGKREGYYQVASRLLGNGFNHPERMALTNALRDARKADPEKAGSKHLKKGEELLTQGNMDRVLNSIQDEGLRSRIRERLMGGDPAPGAQPERRREDARPRREDRPRREAPPRSEQLPSDRPGETNPEVRPDTQIPSADGPLKSPFHKRYEVGDRFKGLTSVYWQGTNTASGIPFNRNEMTAASREFPFGTILNVTNPHTGKSVRVVVTDNGPFAGAQKPRPEGGTTHERVLDISLGASRAIGMGVTVKHLQISVESLPEKGRWGNARRNIHGDYRAQVEDDIRRLSSRRA